MSRLSMVAGLIAGLFFCPAAALAATPLVAAKLGTSDNSQWQQEDRTEDAWVRHTLAFVDDYSNGDLPAARRHAIAALSLAMQLYGPQHVNTADSHNKLALALEATGALDQARVNYQKALDILRQSQGERHPDVATALNNLGNLYSLLKDFRHAESLHLQAMEIRNEHRQTNPAGVAQSAFNLALVYEQQDRTEDAELFYRQAILMWEKSDNPLAVIKPLGTLAALYARLGKYNSAEEMYVRSLEIRTAALGADHLEVAESLFNLGTVCIQQEKYNEAGPYFREALEIMRVKLTPDDPQLAITMYSLANTYHIQAKNEEAWQHEQFSRSRLVQKTADSRHDGVDERLALVMNAEMAQRQEYIDDLYRKAAPLYRGALQIFTRAYGDNHPSVRTVREEFSMVESSIQR